MAMKPGEVFCQVCGGVYKLKELPANSEISAS